MRIFAVFFETKNDNQLEIKLDNLYTTYEGACNRVMKLERKNICAWTIQKPLKGNILKFFCDFATKDLRRRRILKGKMRVTLTRSNQSLLKED